MLLTLATLWHSQHEQVMEGLDMSEQYMRDGSRYCHMYSIELRILPQDAIPKELKLTFQEVRLAAGVVCIMPSVCLGFLGKHNQHLERWKALCGVYG